VSVISRILTERKVYIDVEEAATGRPSTWTLVYECMRYGLRSCTLMSD
jgi:hypothetical protein